ncbi:MAG: NADPH-dependent glutamate synthase [Bacteroidales bacterium]|nr:NADPH-dependent glutamate synthase [Bacteroidales bacterium]
MEKKKKIIDLDRREMPKQSPNIRRSNFLEVAFGYTEELAVAEAKRCLQCKKPFCMDGCPVEIHIPAFIKSIAERDFAASIKMLKNKNCLPAVCGRVCPQEEQCEKTCVLGKKYEPVSIGRLERFVADVEMEAGVEPTPVTTPKKGKKVAIVGSGPAGLSCAGDLIYMGYDVTVFEALHELGGVLVYGIPEFRLPKEIVRKEIHNLEKIGVKFETDMVIGRSLTIDELMQEEGYEAVFIGVGAGLPWFMNIPGENLVGVYSANEFLTRVNLMKAYLFPEYDMPMLDMKGKNVAVMGGGNTAMDAVRISKRLGAKNSFIVYRRSEIEMPARVEEVHHAKEEGVKFLMLTAPIEMVGDENGRIQAMKCIKMELGEPDDSGRRRPIPIEGSEYILDIDVAVIAIGNGSNPLIHQTSPEIGVNKWGNSVVDADTMKTTKKGVFAGGDIVTGGATVILAMGAGRKAAKAIDNYLSNGKERW